MENYSWKLDKNDNSLDDPMKEDDDACDMSRFVITTILTGLQFQFRVRTA